MADNTPDILLHIGADVSNSQNTIRVDLQTAFQRSPLKIQLGALRNESRANIQRDLRAAFVTRPCMINIGISPASLQQIRTDIEQQFAVNRIQLPLHIQRFGVDPDELRREYNEISSQINTLTIDTTPYLRQLREVGKRQRELLRLDPDTDEFRRTLDLYMRYVQRLRDGINAAIRAGTTTPASPPNPPNNPPPQNPPNNNQPPHPGVNSVAFRNMDRDIQESRRQLNLMHGDTTALARALTTVENYMQRARTATTAQDFQHYWDEARVALHGYRTEMSRFQTGGADAARSTKLDLQVQDQIREYGQLVRVFYSLDHPTQELAHAFWDLAEAESILEQLSPDADTAWIQQQLTLVHQLQRAYEQLLRAQTSGRAINADTFLNSKAYIARAGQVEKLRDQLVQLSPFATDALEVSNAIAQLDQHMNRLNDDTAPIEAINEEMAAGAVVIQRVTELVGRLEDRLGHLSLVDSLRQNQKLFKEESAQFNSLSQPTDKLKKAYQDLSQAQNELMNGLLTQSDRWIEEKLGEIAQLRKEYKKLHDDYVSDTPDTAKAYRENKKYLSHTASVNDTIRTLEALKIGGHAANDLDQALVDLQEHLSRLQQASTVDAVNEELHQGESTLKRILELVKRYKSEDILGAVKIDVDTESNKFESYLHTVNPRAHQVYASQIEEIRNMFRTIPNNAEAAQEHLSRMKQRVAEFGSVCKRAGYESGNSIEFVTRKMKEYGTYLVSSLLTDGVYRVFSQIVENVKTLDTALVNIRMVTGDNVAVARDLLHVYNDMAKELGASTVDVSESAVEWLRQGYSEEETNDLIRDSMVLAKVGFMDNAEAAQALTAAMKGYGVAASDAMSIVDKFTQVDQKAATSAGKLATALSKTAANAKVAGLELDEVIGYLAVVNETLQEDAESTGTFMNTLLSRMGNIKAGRLEDPETGESLSDVETTLRSLGIQLRTSNSEFRDFSEVLQEVGSTWGQYSTVQQRAIAVAFSGTRQQTRFLTLMENFQKAQEYITAAAESSGSALEKFGAYEEGVEFKTQRLTASFEELSTNLLDGRIVGALTDMGTGVLEVLNVGHGTILKAATLVPTVMGVVTAFEALKTSSVGQHLQGVITQLNEVGGASHTAKMGLSTFLGAINAHKFLSIGTAVAGIANIAYSIYQSVQEAKRQAIEAALTASDDLDEGRQQLEEYLQEAVRLNEKLEAKNLTLAETRDVHSQLYDIQHKVVDILGDEAEGFNILAIDAEKATDALNEYNRVSAETWLANNGQAISEALEDVEKEHKRTVTGTYFKMDGSAASMATMQAITDEINEYLSKNNVLSGSASILANRNDHGVIVSDIVGDGTYEELQAEFLQFYDFVQRLEQDYGIETNNLLQNLDQDIAYINGKIRDLDPSYQTRDQYALNSLMATYSELYAKYNEIEDGISKAVQEGDMKSLVSLQHQLTALMDESNKDGVFDVDDGEVQKKFASMMFALQGIIDDNMIRVNLSNFDTDDGQLKDSVRHVREAFEGAAQLDDVGDLQNAVKLYNQVKASIEKGADVQWDAAGITQEQANALRELDAALQASGGSIDDLNQNVDLQNAVMGKTVEIVSAEDAAFTALQQTLKTTETEYGKLSNLLQAITDGNLGTYLAGDEEALERLEDLQKTYPGIVSALQDYTDGLIDVNALQKIVFGTATTTYLNDLSDAYEDVHKAAAEYGWTSWQVQSAMSAMSSIMPGLKANLYNNATGLWDISDAALDAALSTDVLRNALTNLFKTTNQSRQNEIDQIRFQMSLHADSVQHDFLQKELDRLLAQQKDEEDQVGKFLEDWGKHLAEIRENAWSAGRSGSSSKSIYEKMKEELDKYLESQQHYIDMLERQIELESRTSMDHADEADDRVANLSKTIESYRAMQKAVRDLIAEYENMGISEESQRIISELEDTWWQYEEAILSATDNVITALDGLAQETTDTIDSLQNAYQTLKDAATEYSAHGFITVDTLQSIIGLGVEYLTYLKDENGQLVINEENIEKVLSAKTQQLAVDTAINYVKKLGIALESQNIAMLNQLLSATTASTSATWDLVYAQLQLLELDGDQYKQALNNINALRALAESTNTTLAAQIDAGSSSNYYDDASDALQKILDLTMDLIRHENEDMVDALEKQKDKYKEIIDLKKEALQEEADDADYNDEIEDRLEEIADLQSRIDLLSLDTSREAAAERMKLEDELAEKQKDLADFQADHSLDKQLDVLDDEYEAYEKTKEQEIEAVKNAVSSTEKIYQQAIARINGDWQGLYQDLLAWNAEYGNTLQQDLVDAWGKATEAVQRYGSYVAAVQGTEQQTGASTAIGPSVSQSPETEQPTSTPWYYDDIDPMAYRDAKKIVDRMKANSQAWLSASETERQHLQDTNQEYADRIEEITGKNVTRDQNGVWWIDGEELYEKFKYHTGGVVGNQPTMKQNEILALLEKDEMVLDKKKQQGAYRLLDFMNELSKVVTAQLASFDISSYIQIPSIRSSAAPKVAAPRTEVNWSPEINVEIHHNGSLAEADAKRYGQTIANTALADLKEAFTKKGVTAFNPVKA